MKHLAIPILEFVLVQPAHKLPVVFTLEKCPLPDCPEEPAEVFQEVLRLRDEGLIEAHIIRGATGKPSKAEIRYVTLGGKIFLDNRNTRGKENLQSGGVPLWVILGLVIFVAVILVSLLGHLSKAPWFHRQVASPKPSPPEMLLPTPTPLPSPEAISSAFPYASPSPTIASSPSFSPTPLPVVSPDPLSKTKVTVPKLHTLHENW